MPLDRVWLARVAHQQSVDKNTCTRPYPDTRSHDEKPCVRPELRRLRAALARGTPRDLRALWKICNGWIGKDLPVPGTSKVLVDMLSLRPIAAAVAMRLDTITQPGQGSQ